MAHRRVVWIPIVGFVRYWMPQWGKVIRLSAYSIRSEILGSKIGVVRQLLLELSRSLSILHIMDNQVYAGEEGILYISALSMVDL